MTTPEPRYTFMGHPVTAEMAKALVNNLVLCDLRTGDLVVRQHTEHVLAPSPRPPLFMRRGRASGRTAHPTPEQVQS